MPKPLTILALIASLLAGVAVSAQMPPISSPTEFHQQPFDVQEYALSMAIENAQELRLSGLCDITIKWLQDVQRPSFPFHLRGPRIDSVTMQMGEVALPVTAMGTPEQDTFHFRVALPNPVRAGELTTISVFYRGIAGNEGGAQPWGGVFSEDSVLYALGVGFHNNYVSTTSNWMPCYDHPSDKAQFKGALFVGALSNGSIWHGKTSIASVGALTSVDSSANTITGFHWNETHPTATYLLTFAAGPFHRLDLPNASGTPIQVYSLARDTANSSISYSNVPKMLSLFSKLYGAYPFDKVGYVNTTKGAMEHQTLINLSLGVVNQRDPQNGTAAHELAHQWFGDLVTPIDFRHAWLTESFATYSESAWVEDQLGWFTYLSSMLNGARNYQRNIAEKEGVFPLYDFPRTAPSSNYPPTIYRKGANVLAMARAIAGTDAFYAALRRFLEAHAYGIASTVDMQEAFRPALGSRTDAFFSEWVYGKGWAKLNVEFRQRGGAWQAVIRQVQQEGAPDWPVFSTLPLNLQYKHPETGAAVDTIAIMEAAELVVDIKEPRGFFIDAGTKSRSLAEVLTTTTVTENPSGTTRLSVRPQPATDHLSIERTPAQHEASLSLTDTSGNQVWSGDAGPGVASLEVDLSPLPNGFYLLQLTTADGTSSLPVCVMR